MLRLRTIRARAAWRGPRVVAVMLGALLALSASCGADYAPLVDGPGSPALVPGNFVLVAVDGKELPYAAPNTNVTFISGDCVVRTNDTFSLNLTTATGSAAPATQAYTGFVAAFNKGSVIFQFAASATQATALINGLGFALPYGDRTLLFSRQ